MPSSAWPRRDWRAGTPSWAPAGSTRAVRRRARPDRICTALDDSEPSYRPCLVEGRFDFSRWWERGAAASFPLNFLKVLPNMIASHVSIAEDVRGPNNTIHQAEASGLWRWPRPPA